MSSKDTLQKAYILPFDQNGILSKEPIKVLFNPEQYSLDKNNQFANIAIPGRQSPVIQFVRGEAETLNLELFFDTWTYHNGEDVKNYTDKISNLLNIKGEIHAPPICKFHWGTFDFTGVIEKVGRRFTMFKEDGTPVRAVLNVTFRQYSSVEEPKSSPDRTKKRLIKEGDSFWLIADREYGDPSKWKEIANANPQIENPRILKSGVEIVIPPLKKE